MTEIEQIKNYSEILLDALSLLRKEILSRPTKYKYSVTDILYAYALLSWGGEHDD